MKIFLLAVILGSLLYSVGTQKTAGTQSNQRMPQQFRSNGNTQTKLVLGKKKTHKTNQNTAQQNNKNTGSLQRQSGKDSQLSKRQTTSGQKLKLKTDAAKNYQSQLKLKNQPLTSYKMEKSVLNPRLQNKKLQTIKTKQNLINVKAPNNLKMLGSTKTKKLKQNRRTNQFLQKASRMEGDITNSGDQLPPEFQNNAQTQETVEQNNENGANIIYSTSPTEGDSSGTQVTYYGDQQGGVETFDQQGSQPVEEVDQVENVDASNEQTGEQIVAPEDSIAELSDFGLQPVPYQPTVTNHGNFVNSTSYNTGGISVGVVMNGGFHPVQTAPDPKSTSITKIQQQTGGGALQTYQYPLQNSQPMRNQIGPNRKTIPVRTIQQRPPTGNQNRRILPRA